MFTRTMRHKVTIRRLTNRNQRGEKVYEEVLDPDGAGPLYLQGQMDLRRRRIVSKEGVEKVVDATFFYLHRDYPDLQEDDEVVFLEKAYRVDGMTASPMPFRPSDYVKVELVLTKTAVPVDIHAGDADE